MFVKMSHPVYLVLLLPFMSQLRSGQTEGCKLAIYRYSADHAAVMSVTTGGLGISIICPSGAIYLRADCCFSEHVL